MKHENCFLPFCEKLIIKKVPISFLYMRFIHSFTHVRFCSTLCLPTFKHPLQLIVIILSPPLNTIKNSPNLIPYCFGKLREPCSRSPSTNCWFFSPSKVKSFFSVGRWPSLYTPSTCNSTENPRATNNYLLTYLFHHVIFNDLLQ